MINDLNDFFTEKAARDAMDKGMIEMKNAIEEQVKDALPGGQKKNVGRPRGTKNKLDTKHKKVQFKTTEEESETIDTYHKGTLTTDVAVVRDALRLYKIIRSACNNEQATVEIRDEHGRPVLLMKGYMLFDR